MDSLTLQDVRCFRGEQTVPLRPLTFLVGENSTGKSTFLAMVRAADALGSAVTPDFNEPPFRLGAFDQLAHFQGRKGKRGKRFKIGGELSLEEMRVGATTLRGSFALTGVFESEAAQPRLCEWSVEHGPYRVTVKRSSTSGITVDLGAPSGRFVTPVRFRPDEFGRTPGWPNYLTLILNREFRGVAAPVNSNDVEGLADTDGEFINAMLQIVGLMSSEGRTIAFAPVRTTPLRTYDPVRDDRTPEGDHVPMVLAKLVGSDKPAWEELRASLCQFGHDSGLFLDIGVDRKGGNAGDPFQIMVGVGRRSFNLVDVGYGVSQVLPILVDAIRAPRGTTFLLQQSEVHLHPRAQAALGTFLANLARTQDKRFIIETHSDYMIDRVLMDVRDEAVPGLTGDDVAILYFSRDGENVRIDPLEFDALGQVVDPPAGYRDFFLREQRRYLGVE